MDSINWLDRDIANGSSKNSVSKKDIKCNNTIKQCKMIKFDVLTYLNQKVINENIKEHNLKWPQIPDHAYRILIY